MSVIVLAQDYPQDGNPLRTVAVGPFMMLCLVLSCVFCAHAVWFLHGRDVPLFMRCECYCYQFCRKMESGLLEIDFVSLTSDSSTTNISLKPLHVIFLQSRHEIKSGTIFFLFNMNTVTRCYSIIILVITEYKQVWQTFTSPH